MLSLVAHPRDPRERLLEMVEEGQIDKDYFFTAAVSFMSWDDVYEFARLNEIELFPEEDEDDE